MLKYNLIFTVMKKLFKVIMVMSITLSMANFGFSQEISDELDSFFGEERMDGDFNKSKILRFGFRRTQYIPRFGGVLQE